MIPRISAVRLFALTLAVAASSAHADPAPATEMVTKGNNVYVRSGANDSYYATTKLAKGTRLTVVGVHGDWARVVPPDGSFSYVAKAYVARKTDASVGVITKSELNVRAGSMLNGLKTTVQTVLRENDEVQILGEQDDFFKIVPPPGVYLYVQTALLEPAPAETAAVTPAPKPAAAPKPAMPAGDALAAIPRPAVPVPAIPVPAVPVPAQPIPAQIIPPDPIQAIPQPAVPVPAIPVPAIPVPAVPIPATPIQGGAIVSITPATQPIAIVPATQPIAMIRPTTKPTEPTAAMKFNAAEAAFQQACLQPIDQQPLASLTEQYDALKNSKSLTSSTRQLITTRLGMLKSRTETRDKYVQAQKDRAQFLDLRQSQQAEQQELAQRMKDQEVSVYSALGTLRLSSLQQTGATLYRLTDPATGRTLVYIRSNDAKYSGMVNQFIGVKGDIAEDDNVHLKILTPTDAETVDTAKVGQTVTAAVMPPSMLGKTASVGQN